MFICDFCQAPIYLITISAPENRCNRLLLLLPTRGEIRTFSAQFL